MASLEDKSLASLSNSSPFSSSFIPFVLENIGNQKLTKFASRAMAVGICGKFIWDFIKSKQSKDNYTSISIFEGTTWFDYVIRWLSKVEVNYEGSEFEFVDLNNLSSGKEECIPISTSKVETKTSFDFIPSSNCKVFIEGIEVIVTRERMARDNNNARWVKDKFIIKVKSKNEEDLEKVFAQIEELGHVKTEYPKCNIYNFLWHWHRTKKIFRERQVVLPNGQFEKLKNVIGKFLNSREEYYDKGLNYRLGILLAGKSGSGKTTTVEAIATQFNLDVYIINLSEMSDSKLMEAVNSLPEKCILLLEDVRKETLTQNSVEGVLSMGGLLNALDGISIPDGRICFMTTNFKDELSPILLRPGRIDYEIEFSNATKEQILDLAAKFKYDITENEASTWEKEDIAMSEVQNRFLGLTKEKL